MQTMKPMANDDIIRDLNFNCKTYDAINKANVSTQNRLIHLSAEKPCDNEIVKSLDSLKGKISRYILKDLEYWPIWNEWLKDLMGIGPFIAGNLILLYYYRFVAICPKCGTDIIKKEIEKENKIGIKINTFFCPACNKSIKGDGVLKHRVDKSKDFPNVSKWWKYMGEHVVDGKMPKNKAGVTSDWSPKGRQISYQIGESFNHMSSEHLYKKHLLEHKAKLEIKYPEKTPGHRHNMAGMVMEKLFLSHFWHIARELEGKSTRGVYADVILGHTGIIPPFYYERKSEKQI